MANLLPAMGRLEYEGYRFSAAVRTEAFSCKPVYDSARRTVIYTQFSLTVKDYISGSINDTTVQAARRLLSKPGGRLIIYGRGVGTFAVNVGAQRDVMWGPQPEVVSVRHAGAKQTIEITWKVDFCLPDCTDAVFSMAFMEVNYSASYAVDRNGLTTRTLAGYVRIPMTRKAVGNRTLPDSVDGYREFIDPPRIEGYRRVPGTFTVSADRCRLDFSITDEPFPTRTAPPAGCMDWKASHTMQTHTAVLMNYDGTIEASYEVGIGLDPLLAFRHFVRFVVARLTPAFDLMKSSSASNPIAVIPRSFSASEPEVNGRQTARFALAYAVVGLRLSALADNSGLWTGGYQQDWKTWDDSVGDDYLGPRGIAQLEFKSTDDVIVDLCRDGNPGLPSGTRPPSVRTRSLTGRFPSELFPAPSPAASWLAYECTIQVESDSGTAELRSLPGAVIPYPPPPASDPGVQAGLPTRPAEDGNVVNDYVGKYKQPDVTLQRRAAPAVAFVIVGKALRLGHPIPVPKLAKVEGQVPRSADRRDRGEGFVTGVVGNLGRPLYGAKWRLRFLIEKLPDVGIDKFLPKNPLLERDAGF